MVDVALVYAAVGFGLQITAIALFIAALVVRHVERKRVTKRRAWYPVAIIALACMGLGMLFQIISTLIKVWS